SDAARISISGDPSGTVDFQGNNSGSSVGITIGSIGIGGPTFKVHNPNSLGSGEFRPNGGTLFNASGGPGTFANTLTLSMGAAGTDSAGSVVFAGNDMTFQGSMAIFRNNANDSRMTVNNNLTLSGGWAPYTFTAVTDPTLPTNRLIIDGTGS